jgi:hypothetical protein
VIYIGDYKKVVESKPYRLFSRINITRYPTSIASYKAIYARRSFGSKVVSDRDIVASDMLEPGDNSQAKRERGGTLIVDADAVNEVYYEPGKKSTVFKDKECTIKANLDGDYPPDTSAGGGGDVIVKDCANSEPKGKCVYVEQKANRYVEAAIDGAILLIESTLLED